MTRLTKIAPVVLTIAAFFAAPALAQAKPAKATVLQVNRGKHRVELVDGHHVVHSYVFTGRVSHKLRQGAVVTYRTKGKRVTSLRVVGRARKVSYIGRVVSSGRHGVVLQLADGRRVRVGSRKSTRRARAAGSVSISLQGLKPGQVVMITESDDGQGNISITIKLVQGPAGGSGDATGGEDQDVVGTVSAIASDGSTLTLQVDGEPDMTFQTDSDLVDGVSVGDQVDVTYFEDTEGSLVADDVEPADDGSGDGSGDDQDAIGTVTAIASDGSTLTLHVDGQPDMTFQTDPSLLDGVHVGDQVDVTYFQDGDGTPVADDVEPADGSSDNSGDGSGDDGSGDGSGDSSGLGF